MVRLTPAFVVAAGAAADAAKIEADGGGAELLQGARQRVHDLVVHGAAVERMRMAHHGERRDDLHPACLDLRGLDERLERPGKARKRRALRERRLGRRHAQGAAAGGAGGRPSSPVRRRTYSGAVARGAPPASAPWAYQDPKRTTPNSRHRPN